MAMLVSYMAAMFSNFCDQIGWTMIQYVPNEMNAEQLHAVVIDEEGVRFHVIGTQSGNFYKLLGNKKKEKIDQQALLKARKESTENVRQGPA